MVSDSKKRAEQPNELSVEHEAHEKAPGGATIPADMRLTAFQAYLESDPPHHLRKASRFGKSCFDLFFSMLLTIPFAAHLSIPSKCLNSAKHGERPILRGERSLRLSQRDHWRSCDCQAELWGGL